MALIGAEEVTLEFTADGIDALAELAAEVNANIENIGARRPHTILGRVLEDIGFEAHDRGGQTITVDAAYVEIHVDDLARDSDLSQFIL